MENKSESIRLKMFLIPAIVAVFFTLFNFLTFYRLIDLRLYDALLHVKPPVTENHDILFLEIDDEAIAKLQLFPWPRNYMAEGLLLMKEFDAAYAVFDIEYTEESPKGVNSSFLDKDIPQYFSEEFRTIDTNIRDLFAAIKDRQISLKDAEVYIDELAGLTSQSKETLLEKVQEIAIDNDRFLGQSARFFGKAFFTVNMLPESEGTTSPELEALKSYVLDDVSHKNCTVTSGLMYRAVDIRPAIGVILENSSGAGYPNVVYDGDGVWRRIDLIREYKGEYFAQLSFRPLLDYLGNPDILFNGESIVLHNAVLPGKGTREISIPLTDNGMMLINWPPKKFEESFRHFSFYPLVRHGMEEDLLLQNLREMKRVGYLPASGNDDDFIDAYDYAESLKGEVFEGGDRALIAEYVQWRKYFYRKASEILSGGQKEYLLKQIDEILDSPNVSEDIKGRYAAIRPGVIEIFDATQKIYATISGIRTELEKELPGSICFIGWTGTSTTDIGVSPFEEEYMNVGMHASIMNTILSGTFLDIFPWWISAIIGFILAILISIIIRNLNPLFSIIVGVGCVAGIILLITALFIATGIYLPMFTPVMICFFTFLIKTFINFLNTEKEKRFIKSAFGHYLSPVVINELISSPEKLTLTGEEKNLTALFTDIRGFSTISEVLTPTDLVKLLNSYLTEMSNIILNQKGTIDKYEGDAIISFFGAPVDFNDHANRACMAAARMKRMEVLLNEHLLRENLSPSPLYTRIGINTGRMTVGNMGTEQKMDYTIMGNAVNLAARLEGVNKQYNTKILISEYTFNEGSQGIVTRKLDRVRVVGIKTPVRLYEVIDEEEFVGEQVKEGLRIFNEALSCFEDKAWPMAQKLFEDARKAIPGDGPADIYIKRCREFQKKPPADTWDGVFNLVKK
ncbi:MAG: CHASE2 domain-containing protein [Spirochaetales bacterium]|nr:CHASE2 domain-containing protein [Spirochaetales bacterium]